jgi:hypothetical protein
MECENLRWNSHSNCPPRYEQMEVSMSRLWIYCYLLYSVFAAGLTLGSEAYGQRQPYTAGDEVAGTLQKRDRVARISFRTASETEIVAFYFATDDQEALLGAQVQVLLPGDVIAARLPWGRGKDFPVVVMGRATTWTFELRPARPLRRAMKYRLRVARLQPAPPSAQQSCQDMLQSLGINAWIIFLSSHQTPTP